MGAVPYLVVEASLADDYANTVRGKSVNGRPTGGQIKIEMANIQIDEANIAQHVAVPPAQYVMITVSDTGMGMDDDTLAPLTRCCGENAPDSSWDHEVRFTNRGRY